MTGPIGDSSTIELRLNRGDRPRVFVAERKGHRRRPNRLAGANCAEAVGPDLKHVAGEHRQQGRGASRQHGEQTPGRWLPARSCWSGRRRSPRGSAPGARRAGARGGCCLYGQGGADRDDVGQGRAGVSHHRRHGAPVRRRSTGRLPDRPGRPASSGRWRGTAPRTSIRTCQLWSIATRRCRPGDPVGKRGVPVFPEGNGPAFAQPFA